jgi:tripartite-type tricarboxylate transporter receptor subunit TctC
MEGALGQTVVVENEPGASVPLTVLPFNGNQEVLTALLGGTTMAGFVNISQDMLPSIESGALRVLAVGTE